MQFLRRAHLYVGLFMIPWAALYGTTAFLINHPGAFPTRQERIIPVELDKYSAFRALAEPQTIAAAVLDELRASPAGETTSAPSALRLPTPEKTTLAFDAVGGKVKHAGQLYDFEVQLSRRELILRNSHSGTGADVPFRRRGQLPDQADLARKLETDLTAMMAANGIEGADPVLEFIAPVKFLVADDRGQEWDVEYEPMTGAVDGSPVSVSHGLPLRDFLLQLHYSARYPGNWETRWLWAVGVDATAFSLLFWAISGVLMFWQIKAVRTRGLLTLAASVAVGTGLTIGMYRVLTS